MKISKNTGEIYKITNLSNDKIYIGQTHSYTAKGEISGYKKRCNAHMRSAFNKNWNKKCRALYSAIRKYGKDNFKIELLEIVNVDDLDKKEKYYIKTNDSLSPNGYNLIDGGNKWKEI